MLEQQPQPLAHQLMLGLGLAQINQAKQLAVICLPLACKLPEAPLPPS